MLRTVGLPQKNETQMNCDNKKMEETKKHNEKFEKINECRKKIDITTCRMENQMMKKRKVQEMNQENGSGATQRKKMQRSPCQTN